MVQLPERLSALDSWLEAIHTCPWSATIGTRAVQPQRGTARLWLRRGEALYTEEEKRRRDSSAWTIVQGILAPLQFAVFLVSLGLVLNYVVTGTGLGAATLSIIIKTAILYTIMVTGAIWEKVVFGRYLFAPAFFWEDVASMGVIALHTAYLAMIIFGLGTAAEQIAVALAAYAAYVFNATQFLLKLRAARRLDTPSQTLGAA